MKTVENIKLDHISAERLLQISMVLKTIANPVRLKIVLILIQQGESTVGDLKEQLDIEQSLLSHHLSNLRMNGVISTRKVGRSIFCQIQKESVVKVLHCLNNCPSNNNA